MDYLPIFIRLQDQPAVVVGGGRVGLRKVELLRKAGARVTVVAPQLHRRAARSLSARGEISHIEARISSRATSMARMLVIARHRTARGELRRCRMRRARAARAGQRRG